MTPTDDTLAQRLRAVADPVRLRLLRLIRAKRGKINVSDLADAIELTQPTTTYHMQVLADAGLVSRRRAGKDIYYLPRPEAAHALADSVREALT